MKPKIYGLCDAGCRWETIHKEDFEKTVPYQAVNLDGLSRLKVEKGVKYKIINKPDSSSYDFKINLIFKNTTITLENPTYDKYKDYIYFKLLDVVLDENNRTVVIYEIDGIRKTKVSDDGLYTLRKLSCLFNPTDATVYGDGETYFRYSWEEVSDGTSTRTVKLVVKEERDENGNLIERNSVLEGDIDFVESRNGHSVWNSTEQKWKGQITELIWKKEYYPTDSLDKYYGLEHTYVSGDCEYVSFDNSYGEEVSATYSIPTINEITSYYWEETTGGYVLVNDEVVGNNYIAYYRKDEEISTYNCYVSDLDYAYECNEEGFKNSPTSLFIKYSNDKVIMSNTYDNHKYVGTYIGQSSSNNPDDYTWMLIGIQLDDSVGVAGEMVEGEIIVGQASNIMTGSGVSLNSLATKEYVDNAVENTGGAGGDTGSGIVVIEKIGTLDSDSGEFSIDNEFTAEEFNLIKENNAEVHVEFEVDEGVKLTHVFTKKAFYNFESIDGYQAIFTSDVVNGGLILVVAYQEGEIQHSINEVDLTNNSPTIIEKQYEEKDNQNIYSFDFTENEWDKLLNNTAILYITNVSDSSTYVLTKTAQNLSGSDKLICFSSVVGKNGIYTFSLNKISSSGVIYGQLYTGE